jgi:hypothetical protein
MRVLAGLLLSLSVAALSPAQTMLNAGSLAHFASGGGWSTTFFLFNTGAAAAQVQLNFYRDDGTAVVIPLDLPQLPGGGSSGAQFEYTLQPGTVLTVVTDSSDTTSTTGWAQLQASSSSVTGYLIFRYEGTSGSGVQEAVVTPETRNGTSYVIAFDNTDTHFTSYALANVTNQPVVVTATARDALTGNVLGSSQTITLPAMGHHADQLSGLLPYTTSASGTVEFATPSAGQISVLGLRFSLPTDAFTSTPPILKQ